MSHRQLHRPAVLTGHVQKDGVCERIGREERVEGCAGEPLTMMPPGRCHRHPRRAHVHPVLRLVKVRVQLVCV